MIDCPCKLPDGNKPTFQCERLGCKMTPHWCALYQTHEGYRTAWDEGRGPGQGTVLGDPKFAKWRKSHAGLEPWDAETADWIIRTVCGTCKHHLEGACDTRKQSPCAKKRHPKGRLIAEMLEKGVCCPKGMF